MSLSQSLMELILDCLTSALPVDPYVGVSVWSHVWEGRSQTNGVILVKAASFQDLWLKERKCLASSPPEPNKLSVANN